MPRNGTNGNYSLPIPPFTPSTVISSSDVNSDLSDIAAALTGSLSADGQTVLTGQLKGTVGTTPTYSGNAVTTSGFGIAAGPQPYLMVAGVQIIFATSTGASVIGTLTSSGALTVSAGGAIVTGNSTVTGTLTVSSTLTVSAGGAAIAGNSTVTGTLTVSSTLTASSGFTVSAGAVSFPTASISNAAITNPGMTVQYLLSGTVATYTTPAGVKTLRVKAIGAGGGGGGTSGAGGTGGTTIFNGINANGGGGGSNSGPGGTGGTGGTGSASFRIDGCDGCTPTFVAGGGSAQVGGSGGSGVFGGAGRGGGGAATTAGKANTGGGGGGSGNGSNTEAGGGASGEYFELLIQSPAASYTYTIPAGGTGGSGNGAVGGSGLIIVEEYY